MKAYLLALLILLVIQIALSVLHLGALYYGVNIQGNQLRATKNDIKRHTERSLLSLDKSWKQYQEEGDALLADHVKNGIDRSLKQWKEADQVLTAHLDATLTNFSTLANELKQDIQRHTELSIFKLAKKWNETLISAFDNADFLSEEDVKILIKRLINPY